MTTTKPDGENEKLKPIHCDPDARRWADEFFMAWNRNLKPDYEWMVTWFSNSIMCGYDHGRSKERAEAEKKIKELEKRLLRDETVDYRAEQAHWILMKQVKELELKYQAARNVLLEYASLDENGVSKSMNESDIRYVDEQIESEFQRLKEETNDNT